MNVALYLARAARNEPDRPALQLGFDALANYAQLAGWSAAVADELRTRYGVGAGDRVGVFMKNNAQYLPLLFGIWALGAVAVPVNAKLHPREATWIMSDADARVVFADRGNSGALKAIGNAPFTCVCVEENFPTLDVKAHKCLTVQDCPDTDLAWLFYTSGTTGRPKGVMLSHGNLVAMAHAYLVDVDDPGIGGATLYAAPMSHGGGLYSIVHMLRASCHIVPASQGFDCAEVLEIGERSGSVSIFAVPTMVRRLVDHVRVQGGSGKGLRTIVYGGGPMYTSDIEDAVAVMGPRFVQIYGQGETPMTITTLSRAAIADRSKPDWRDRLASVGLPYSSAEVRIVDGERGELPTGEIGEIIVRGPTVMQGYWRNAEATAAALRDGWLWTGDMGSMSTDGYVTLRDRSKDVIISGGTNIYPREVEEALLTHPEVVEVCVVGRPSAEWGEDVVAFVVVRSGSDVGAASLDRHCTEQIARFKRPKDYFFTESLPKSDYGKILKTTLRQRLDGLREVGSV